MRFHLISSHLHLRPLYYTHVLTPHFSLARSIILVPTLLVLFFLLLVLLLLLLLVALLAPEFLFPDLASGIPVQIREHEVENFGVPRDGFAFDTLFDVLLFRVLAMHVHYSM